MRIKARIATGEWVDHPPRPTERWRITIIPEDGWGTRLFRDWTIEYWNMEYHSKAIETNGRIVGRLGYDPYAFGYKTHE